MKQDKFYYLGLGSNLGDREMHLCAALDFLELSPEIAVGAVSSIYETEPWGMRAQPAFLNLVCGVSTTMHPEDLLEAVLNIEQRLGRRRVEHWGPRTVDIDLLVCGEMMHQSSVLIVPHPHLHERLFVLTPLAELAPHLVVPGLNRCVETLLADCQDTGAVKRIKSGVDLWRKPQTSKM